MPGILDRLLNRKPGQLEHPRSDSGRGHYGGFLDEDELNSELRGQAGLRVYDKMFRGDHDIRRNVMMIVNALVGAAWATEPYGGDQADEQAKQIADDVSWALGLGDYKNNSPNLTPWAYHLAEFLPVLIRSGFCPGEVWWTRGERDGRQILTPRKVGLRLPRTIHRWILDEDGELGALEQFRISKGDYVPLPRQDLLYYRVGAEGDNWEGISMLRPVYKAWLIKDKIERLDAQGIEREAVGLPVVYPPKGGATDPGIADDMETKLGLLRANKLAFLMMPGPKAETDPETGWSFELMGLGGSGGGGKRDAQPSLQYWRDAISAGFIEEFMRLGQGGGGSKGALATAEVQDDPFTLACAAFAEPIVAEVLQILVRRFVNLNYGEGTPLPQITMSVSEDSLAEFAAGIAPLVTAGLVHPDDPLEDFLRQRGKLPPADPAAREERKQALADQAEADLEARKAGAAVKPGEESQHEATTERVGPDGSKTVKRETKTTKPVALDDAPPAHSGRDAGALQIVTPVLGADGRCEKCDKPEADCACKKTLDRGDLRAWEQVMPLDQLDDVMRSIGPGVLAVAKEPIRAIAAQAAADIAKGKTGPDTPPDDLLASIESVLRSARAFGDASVRREIEAQRAAAATVLEADVERDAIALAKLPSDNIAKRAWLIGKAIVHAITGAATAAHVNGTTDPAGIAAAGETAGDQAAESHGKAHAGGALNQGREDAAAEFAHLIKGSRYTSILDRNRCQWCAQADDGVLRALTDPIRIARRPPNVSCQSTLSGVNRCRCLEFFELNDEAPAYLDEGVDADAAGSGDRE